jgi:excinuclease ABC subunit B
MRVAISETQRRRKIQMEYNAEHGIDPQTVRRKVSDILLAMQGDGSRRGAAPTPARGRRRKSDFADMPREELERLIRSLEEEMHQAAKDLRFEYAARLRDEVHELRRELSALREAGVG